MLSPALRLEHLHHQVDDGAVRVELLRRVPAVVGELLDQELVAVAELVLGHVGERERLPREVLEQVLERDVGQALLVGPRSVAEDAVEPVRVGRFDRAECRLDGFAHVLRGCAHVLPVRTVRDDEAVVRRRRSRRWRRPSTRRGRRRSPRPTRPRGACRTAAGRRTACSRRHPPGRAG